MKRYLTHILAFSLLATMFVPGMVFGQGPGEEEKGPFNLIVCGEDANNNKVLDKEEQCGFGHLILLAKNLINALIVLSTLLATAAFAYAGFLLLTSGGSESAKTKAKDIGMKVLKGYLWILVAWLLVYTITSALLEDGYSLLGAPTN